MSIFLTMRNSVIDGRDENHVGRPGEFESQRQLILNEDLPIPFTGPRLDAKNYSIGTTGETIHDIKEILHIDDKDQLMTMYDFIKECCAEAEAAHRASGAFSTDFYVDISEVVPKRYNGTNFRSGLKSLDAEQFDASVRVSDDTRLAVSRCILGVFTTQPNQFATSANTQMSEYDAMRNRASY